MSSPSAPPSAQFLPPAPAPPRKKGRDFRNIDQSMWAVVSKALNNIFGESFSAFCQVTFALLFIGAGYYLGLVPKTETWDPLNNMVAALVLISAVIGIMAAIFRAWSSVSPTGCPPFTIFLALTGFYSHNLDVDGFMDRWRSRLFHLFTRLAGQTMGAVFAALVVDSVLEHFAYGGFRLRVTDLGAFNSAGMSFLSIFFVAAGFVAFYMKFRRSAIDCTIGTNIVGVSEGHISQLTQEERAIVRGHESSADAFLTYYIVTLPLMLLFARVGLGLIFNTAIYLVAFVVGDKEFEAPFMSIGSGICGAVLAAAICFVYELSVRFVDYKPTPKLSSKSRKGGYSELPSGPYNAGATTFDAGHRFVGTRM